jgi:hypothetical protein
MMRILLWMVIAILLLFVLYPVFYLVLHWSDSSFRSEAVGNWFGTVVGIVVGVPAGMVLTRAQQRAQAEADRRREKAIRMEHLRSIKHRVYDELQHNSGVVADVADILSKSATARSDLWGWAFQVVGAVEFDAYRELDSVLLPEERAAYGSLALAYLDLRRVVNRIRASTAAHAFLIGYSADEKQANRRLGEAQAHINIVQLEIATGLKDISSPGQAILPKTGSSLVDRVWWGRDRN